MNSYLKDAGVFLQEASNLISEDMGKAKIIQGTLNFALGVERVLKGVLFDVNPTYILADPTFNNSLQILYKEKLIEDKGGHSELIRNANADVITFRTSLVRAQAISSTAFNHKNLLFTLSNARDIIAHNDLGYLSFQTLELILKRDFYSIVADFCEELSISKGKYFGGVQIKLSELSSKYTVDIDKKLALLYVAHRERWASLKGKQGYIEGNDRITEQILKVPGTFQVQCPACGNRAVIFTNQVGEFDRFEKKEVVVGLKVNELKCRYCKLNINEYSDLDYLRLDSLIRCDL